MRFLLLPLFFFLLVAWLLPADAGTGIDWIDRSEDGEPRVHLYFFWSLRCPHCRDALPFIDSLTRKHPWIQVHDHELTGSRSNAALYVQMAEALGEEARSVPAFIVCGRMLTGYDSPEGMGREILDAARLCQGAASASALDQAEDVPGAVGSPGGLNSVLFPETRDDSALLRLPFLGEIDARDMTLPLFTLVIAGLDAFNPCAFFVLLFLLSLMVHARSRSRMLIIGGAFVFFSGLIYFLFMAAWLNLFLVLGAAPAVTLVAGLVALVIGVLNTKDFFLFHRGPSLSIPDGAKPGLFRRMRGLLEADSMTAMLVGTVTLALAANSYELLCTAGFPMVYTRVLTVNQLGELQYYAYLALYNLIYVLPLLAIVIAFTATLGTRKLSERQGRALKLVSGLMMLGLGILMLVAPERLGDFRVAGALLGGALGAAMFLVLWERWRGAKGGTERT